MHQRSGLIISLMMIGSLLLPLMAGMLFEMNSGPDARIVVTDGREDISVSHSDETRAQGDDEWTMFGGDNVNSFNYPDESPDTDNVLWDQGFPADFSASPAIVDGLLYIGGTDYKLHCIDGSTGETVYTHPFPSGIVSTPCIDGDMLYVGCRDYRLHAFDLSQRTEVWSFLTGGDVDSSPKIKGDNVYFGSLDGYIYSVDTATHNLTWKYSPGGDHMIKSSPAISGDKLVVGSYELGNANGKIMCLDTDGFSDGNDGFDGEGNTTSSDGDVIWEYDVGAGVKGSASIMGDRVFVGSDNKRMYCLDLDDGSLVWDAATGNTIDACPTPVAETNSVIFGSWDSYLYNLNASTGSTIWKAQMTGYTSGAALVAEGRVYVGDLDYNLYCFDLPGNGDLTTDTIWGPVSMGTHQRCRAGPVIHNGILYQACENGDALNSGKIVAIGSPEVKVYDIRIDDISPYQGEMINIEAVVKNFGKVDCSMDLEIHYASMNNQIKVLIDKQRIEARAGSYGSLNVPWRAREGVWNIWVGIKNSTPEDRTTQYHLNFFQGGDFVVSSTPEREWNTYLRDPEHSGWDAVPVDTNRVAWKIDVGGSLFQPVIAEGAVVVANAGGSVYAYDSVDNVERWHRDLGGRILSTPTILGGKVFVPMEGFKLVCLRIAPDGATNWTFNDPGITDPITPVMAAHGIVLLATEEGRIIALDEDDGQILWDRIPGGSLSTVPLIFEDTLAVIDEDGVLYLLDLFFGTVVRKKELGIPDPFTPSHMHGAIYAAFEGGKIIRYDPKTNLSSNVADLGEELTTGIQFVSEGGAKAVGTLNGLRILDATNTPMALVSTGGPISSRPSGAPDRCYIIDGNGLLCCINASVEAGTGDRMLWNLSLGSGSGGTPAIREGKVYASGGDGYLYCLGAPNKPPVALLSSPGSGDEFLENDEIQFSGAGSMDPDQDRLRYRWTSDIDGTLYDGYTASFSIRLSPGNHEIRLEVDDQKGGKDRKTIIVYVHGRELERMEFPKQSMKITAQVIGDGQIKSDWTTEVAGVMNDSRWKVVHVTNDHPWTDWMNISFDLSPGSRILPDMARIETVRMYILDENQTNWSRLSEGSLSVAHRTIHANLTGRDSMMIGLYGEIEEVVEDMERPVARAGGNREVIAGSIVFFDGSESTDNVDVVNYTWTFDYEGEMRLSGIESSHRFDIPGEYVVTLNVSDTAGNWALNSFNLTVKEEVIEPPEKTDHTLTIIFILVIVILIIGILIFREARGRMEQRRMDDAFFKDDGGKSRRPEEPDGKDVDQYVDMFSVEGKKEKGGKKTTKGTKKGAGKKEVEKDEDSGIPQRTVGGFEVRKTGKK